MPFNLSKALIRQHATAESLRGMECFEGDVVLSVVRRDNVLQAKVEGSQPEMKRPD